MPTDQILSPEQIGEMERDLAAVRTLTLHTDLSPNVGWARLGRKYIPALLASHAALAERVAALEDAERVALQLAEWSRRFNPLRVHSASEEKACREWLSQIETSARAYADATPDARAAIDAARKDKP